MRKPTVDLSRRTFLKGTVGTATALAVSGAYTRDLLAQDADLVRAGYTFLSPTEVPIVEAFAEQVWPSDDAGLGGAEVGVVYYIDRALSGPYQQYQPVYREGLDWLNEAAVSEYGSGFAELAAADQTAFLEKHLGMPSAAPSAVGTPAAQSATPVADASGGVATPAAQQNDLGVEGMQLPGETVTGASMIAGGDPPQVADLGEFLDIMLTHTIEGLFADPAYGGNIDTEVWRTLNYGGPYYVHTEEQQTTFEPLDLPIQTIADL
jgi:gluconate 2-dehydrogenase gamma chain